MVRRRHGTDVNFRIQADVQSNSLTRMVYQEMLDEWMDEIEDLRAVETHAWNRRNFIARKQAALSKFYESEPVQYIVATMIVMNFLIEAFRLCCLIMLNMFRLEFLSFIG